MCLPNCNFLKYSSSHALGVGRNSRTHLDGEGVCQHHPQSCLWLRLHGFPLLQQRWSLRLLVRLCRAEQKPYLKEAIIIRKPVVCVSKIKLLHFFHPFASHFPGNSTTPQAAACHGWLMRAIQQQGAIFMGIHDFLTVTAFASQPVLHNRDFLRCLVLLPLANNRIRNLEGISTRFLVWIFEQMPSKRKKVY